MSAYLFRRFVSILPVLFAVSSIVFFLLHLIPGDPIDLILGEQAMTIDRQELKEQLHLDEPLLLQYGSFLKGIAVGDWGKSIFDRRPVLEHLHNAYPATLLLAAAAMCIAMIFAIPFGMLAAVKRNSLWDSLAMFLALVGISIPNFWLGPVLILIFSVELGWLPISGIDSLASLILPAVTLGFALAAMLSRMTRSSLIEEIRRDYVTAARAKGISEGRVLLKHAFRNALNPIVTIVGLQIGTLLAGTIVTEKIFGWPGVGMLLLESISRRDYPVVQGCILLISFAYVIMNTATDCFYKAIDPRVNL